MGDNICVTVFGTFGIPNGFRQTAVIGNKEKFSDIKTFDLNTNAIKIFQDTKLYAIRKEVAKGENVISYAVYSYVKEKTSNRGGTFIGSAIIFYNKILPENLTIHYLDKFHDLLISNRSNVSNSTMQVNHSDYLQVPQNIKDFDKAEFNLKAWGEINFMTTKKDLIVYIGMKPEVFEKSLELLNDFDTIFFTKSKDIAQFVHEKKLIELIESADVFENKIQSLRIRREEEKRRKLNQVIENLEDGKERLEEQEKQYLQKQNEIIQGKIKQFGNCKLQIKQYEEQLLKNEEEIKAFENQLIIVSKKFIQHKKLIDLAITQLKNNSKQPDEVSVELKKGLAEIEKAKKELMIPDIKELYNKRRSQHNASYSDFMKSDYSKYKTVNISDNHSSKALSYYVIVFLLLLLGIMILYFLPFNMTNLL